MPHSDTLILDDAGIGNAPLADSSDGGDARIRCPICNWQPQKESRWMCNCKHMWNTFDTGGICPACMLRWTYTACLACSTWSLHSDWYRKL